MELGEDGADVSIGDSALSQHVHMSPFVLQSGAGVWKPGGDEAAVEQYLGSLTHLPIHGDRIVRAQLDRDQWIAQIPMKTLHVQTCEPSALDQHVARGQFLRFGSTAQMG
jgi:hypothetical protein